MLKILASVRNAEASLIEERCEQDEVLVALSEDKEGVSTVSVEGSGPRDIMPLQGGYYARTHRIFLFLHLENTNKYGNHDLVGQCT